MNNTDLTYIKDAFTLDFNSNDGFTDSQTAFEDAIASGRLSSLPGTVNYVGLFMYMGNRNGVSLFKNINTRVYI